MVQIVNVVHVCDLHDAEVESQETLRFRVGGSEYEIDACVTHAQELRASFQSYIEHGRRVGVANRPRHNRSASGRARMAEIRAWAREHGHKISQRGRIPATIVAEYKQTH